jgi:MFS superfamily sulfate permease-like transporter
MWRRSRRLGSWSSESSTKCSSLALSIAATLERMSNPTIARLGMLGESRNFVDVSFMTEAKTDPHILILRPSQPLFFANAEATLSRIVALATSGELRTAILSLEDSDSLDSTALDALIECEQSLTREGRTLILARVKQDILEALDRCGPSGWVAAVARLFQRGRRL